LSPPMWRSDWRVCESTQSTKLWLQVRRGKRGKEKSRQTWQGGGGLSAHSEVRS